MLKKRHIHTPPDPSFHPPSLFQVVQGTSSSALLKILCIGSKMEDGEWHKSLSSNPKGVLWTQNTMAQLQKLLGKMRVFVIQGGYPDAIPPMLFFCWVRRSPRSLRLSMLRSYAYSSTASLSECQLWNPASCNDQEQITTNFSSLGGSLDLRIRKKLGVEAQI